MLCWGSMGKHGSLIEETNNIEKSIKPPQRDEEGIAMRKFWVWKGARFCPKRNAPSATYLWGPFGIKGSRITEVSDRL